MSLVVTLGSYLVTLVSNFLAFVCSLVTFVIVG
jgi:hypothetical protein